MKVNRRSCSMLVVALTVALASCSGGDDEAPEAPTLPALDGVEAAVAERVRERHAAVMKDLAGAQPWLRYAMTLHAHDMTPQAREAYETAASLGADAFKTSYLIGCLLSKGQPDEALGSFLRALDRRRDYTPAHLRTADIHLARGELAAAKKHFGAALDGAPSSSHAHFGLARVALQEGRVHDAIGGLESALRANPDHVEVWAVLSRAHARNGETDKARAAGEKVEARSASTPMQDPVMFEVLAEGVAYTSLERMTLMYMNAGQNDEALTWAERALKVNPENLDAIVNKARILARLGRHDDALSHLDFVLRERKNNIPLMMDRAGSLYATGRRADALEATLEVYKLDKTHLFANYLLGKILQSARPQIAEKHLRFVLSKEPDHHDARTELAAVLGVQKRFSEAHAELDLVIARAPDHKAAKQLRAQLPPR